MQSVSRSQRIRRVLLWVLPVLALLSLITLTWMPRILQNQVQASEENTQIGWTTWLQDMPTASAIMGNGCGRLNDFNMDERGWIWVAPTPLAGLHYYDGQKWTSREGIFQDLAIDPEGDVWAVHNLGDNGSNGVDIFDGQQWKNYDSIDLGLVNNPVNQQIMQVEVGRDGRIWAITNQFPNQLVEIIPRDGGYLVSDPAITLTDVYIQSIDTDNNGNVWVAVWGWGREGDEPEWPPGLYTFDGEMWRRVPDESVDLSRVIRTRFDDEGNAWVITEDGAVMTYEGPEWTTIVAEDSSPVNPKPSSDKGLFVDSQDRLWLWQSDSAHLLDNGNWTSFTEENSGFAERNHHGRGIFGVLVDDHDRLWIASYGGVSMIPVKDANPLPDESVNRNRTIQSLLYTTKGMNLYLPGAFILLWLAVFFNALPGVLIAFVLGVFLALSCGPPRIAFAGYETTALNPGVPTAFCGMVGGLIGGLIDRTQVSDDKAALRWNYILAVIGLIVGFGLGLFFYIGATP